METKLAAPLFYCFEDCSLNPCMLVQQQRCAPSGAAQKVGSFHLERSYVFLPVGRVRRQPESSSSRSFPHPLPTFQLLCQLSSQRVSDVGQRPKKVCVKSRVIQRSICNADSRGRNAPLSDTIGSR